MVHWLVLHTFLMPPVNLVSVPFGGYMESESGIKIRVQSAVHLQNAPILLQRQLQQAMSSAENAGAESGGIKETLKWG